MLADQLVGHSQASLYLSRCVRSVREAEVDELISYICVRHEYIELRRLVGIQANIDLCDAPVKGFRV